MKERYRVLITEQTIDLWANDEDEAKKLAVAFVIRQNLEGIAIAWQHDAADWFNNLPETTP